MNIFKKGLMATAAVLTLGMGAIGSAHADTYATSILRIENFRLLTAPTGPAFTPGSFTTLRGTNNAHATARLNGVPQALDGQAPIEAGALNIGPACQGTCPALADVYNIPPTPPLPPYGTTFGFADQFLSGSALSEAGVVARTRADAATTANMNSASGDSDVGTSTTFQFALGADSEMWVAFNAAGFTEAFVTPGSGPVADANARLSWSINIVDVAAGNTVFSYAPSELNAMSLRSATDAAPGTATYVVEDSFLAGTGLLTGGRLYQLTIQHNTLANVLQEEVPEPATLAIIAAGLLSMSLVSRRRRS